MIIWQQNKITNGDKSNPPIKGTKRRQNCSMGRVKKLRISIRGLFCRVETQLKIAVSKTTINIPLTKRNKSFPKVTTKIEAVIGKLKVRIK